MSDQNVELVRGVYEEWARGDFTSGEAFHPDVEFEMPDWPEAATSRGVEAMRRTWQEALSAWDDFRAEPEDFLDAGEHVVVLTRATARGKGSGADVLAHTATVWTIDEGKVVRLALYWNVPNALEAAGLPS